MANQQHIDWLLEGVEAWNARRERDDFIPDFEEADIRGAFEAADKMGENRRFDLTKANLRAADLVGANLGGADLEGADLRRTDLRRTDLRGADLRGADLRGADLRGADLRGAGVRTIVYAATGKNDGASVEYTDLSSTRNLSQVQVDVMEGDSGTILPDAFKRPDHWPESKFAKISEAIIEPAPPSPIRYTPPAEFETRALQLDVQHFPERPKARNASATPVDTKSERATRIGLEQLASTFCSALRKYKREDAQVSNRVRAAEQVLVTSEALVKCLREPNDTFLPTLFEDYVETLALGYNEDVQAFEANDVALYQRLIKRGRQLYAFYPELEEISDPTNTRFIPDDFPYSLDQMREEVADLVYSDDGLRHFSDTTRELIDAEINARVPRDQDEEKTKLARLGGLVGEMRREMDKYAEKGQDAVNRVSSWIKSYEKVQKIWDKIEPFIGRPPDA